MNYREIKKDRDRDRMKTNSVEIDKKKLCIHVRVYISWLEVIKEVKVNLLVYSYFLWNKTRTLTYNLIL